MRLDKNSIRCRVILPILIITLVIGAFSVYTTKRAVDGVVRDYRALFVEQQTFEVKKFLERAINELSTARLIGNQAVVSAKKEDVLEEIKLYWSNNGFQGIVTTADSVLASSLSYLSKDDLLNLLKDKQYLSFKHSGIELIAFRFYFPSWDWHVFTVAKPRISDTERLLRLLVPFIVIGFVVILAIVYYLYSTVVKRSIDGIVNDIASSRTINKTGITEMDIIGSAINRAFEDLKRQTAHYMTLHSIAISLYEQASLSETINHILRETSKLIGAERYFLFLFNRELGANRFISSEGIITDKRSFPMGQGIIGMLMKTREPLRINDLSAHPSFSGSFPEGHPIINNLLSYPLFYAIKELMGVICFGNKEGGFTEGDENLLRAISADVALAINKAEALSQLERFKLIIESSFEMVIVTDSEGTIQYVNPAFERITGYSRQEAIGRDIGLLQSGYHDEDFYKNIWETLRSGRPWQGEFVNRTKGGELINVASFIFPLEFEQERSFVAIQRDITNEKRLYEQLLRAQKMEAIGTLAGGIAHDFNNILTAISGYSELLLSRVEESHSFYKPIRIINDAAKRAADLTRKLLTITRKEKQEVKAVDINKIVNDVVEILRHSMPKDIEIVTRLDSAVPEILADPSQIHQVLMNLTVNARDAMPEGGIITIATQKVGVSKNHALGDKVAQGEFVKISVSDTGAGIDTKLQQKVFDPFFTTKAAGKGTGLGLYIVHSIVTNHNGYINLYSEPGKGTRFNIYLPITRPSVEEATGDVGIVKGHGFVLIIDDEEEVRTVSSDMLQTIGFSVIGAKDGKEGLQKYIEHKEAIKFVILDMIMPKMGGNEVFAALREINPDVKVIICSGFINEGYAGIERLMQSGAKAFLQKPFALSALHAAINKALA